MTTVYQGANPNAQALAMIATPNYVCFCERRVLGTAPPA